MIIQLTKPLGSVFYLQMKWWSFLDGIMN